MLQAEPGSIRDVAASLIVKPPAPEPQPTREQERVPETEAQPIPPDEDEDEEGQAPAEGDDSQELAPDGDAAAEVDQTYQVKIDDEIHEVSLSDLIKAYSGEGAIAKRLNEVHQLKLEATKARDTALEQERVAAKADIQRETETLRTQASQLAQVYQTYATAILQPEVQLPDPTLRTTDPVGWLTAMEAYRQDQDRLRDQAAHMQEVVAESNRLEQERLVEFARDQMQKMIGEVPAMADPEYRKAQVSRVMEVGKAVGYSEAEIRAGAMDRRMIYLAMLAAKGAEDMIKTRTGGTAKVEAKAAAPRPQNVVRSRNGQYAAVRANADRARQTGKVEDVAKTMIVSAPKPGQRPRA